MLAFAEAVPLKRAEIARRTGLSRASITRLATGERGKALPHDTVVRVAALYDSLLPTVNK